MLQTSPSLLYIGSCLIESQRWGNLAALACSAQPSELYRIVWRDYHLLYPGDRRDPAGQGSKVGTVFIASALGIIPRWANAPEVEEPGGGRDEDGPYRYNKSTQEKFVCLAF